MPDGGSFIGAKPIFRRLLMLQGPVGPFFWLLARRLRRTGVAVHKVNFNAGDALFYPGPDARAFRGRRELWPDYLDGLIDALDIDAIALFGDCRRHHREAIRIAERKNIPVLVFEEGYLRPDHITVESGGVNGNSRSLRCGPVPASEAGQDTVSVGNSFPAMSSWALLYWMAMDLGRFAYPHYRHHRAGSVAEGFAFLRSGLRKLWHRRQDNRTVQRLIDSDAPFFLLPLQVHFDSQMTEHSPFTSVAAMIETVVHSFAAHAPRHATLLIKHHPLDRGHRCYRDLIRRLAEEAGCRDRILYVRDGHLPTLLAGAAGTVTCNSTVGLSSLWHGTPVKALGRAIYDRPGLSFQGRLDEFWRARPRVDKESVAAFISTLKATSQANGNFYTAYRRTRILESVANRMAEQYAATLTEDAQNRRRATLSTLDMADKAADAPTSLRDVRLEGVG